MVSLIAPADLERRVPFTLRPDAEAGTRFGGRAPSGIRPKRATAATVYLATIPLARTPVRDVSIFLTERQENTFLSEGGRLYVGSDLGPVEVVSHPRSERGAESLFHSRLSEKAIVLGAEDADWYTNDEGERVLIGGHKIGGRPALFKDWHLEEPVNDLLRCGYVQVLQLDFPSADDDVVSGDWPFGDGMFHLLGREPFGDSDWACFWEN